MAEISQFSIVLGEPSKANHKTCLRSILYGAAGVKVRQLAITSPSKLSQGPKKWTFSQLCLGR
jgi:hypothetical protein